MSAFHATARREALQAVVGGRAWSLAIATAVLTGLPLAANAAARTGVADFVPAFSIGAWCVLVAAALLGAASVSSERRNGTWDLVLSAPERPSATIWAKLAAMGVSAAVLLAGFPIEALVESSRNAVDWASVLGGMLGLWCLGVAAGSLGIVAGTIVRSGLGATALALLVAGAWVSVTRSMQVLGDPWSAAVGFALDPIRRAQEFSGGAFDLGSVITLLGVALSCTWMAARWADTERRLQRAGSWQRRLSSTVMALVALVVVGIAARGPGAAAPRMDVHQLLRRNASEALQKAVSAADAPVQCTLLVAKGVGDPAAAAARSAMDRMRGCTEASGAAPTTMEVDLLAPLQAGNAAQAMERITASESAALGAWNKAFAKALATLDAVCGAGDLAGPLAQAVAARPQGDPKAGKLQALLAALQRGTAEGAQWHAGFEAAAAAAPERPLGDVEGAGRALAAELGVWAQLLRDGADTLGLGAVSRELREAARRMVTLSDACRASQDGIDRLPPMRLGEVAAAIRTPPVLVVSTGKGSAAIPAWRLLEGEASADAAMVEALAAAQGAARNAVVFVHATQRSPLEATAGGADFAFMADALRAARFRVEAWNPSQAPRPAARNAQRRAWVVLPPLDRRSLEPDAAEQALLQATHRLIEEGESVLVLTTPSVSATLGMTDPWSDVLRACGVTARTDAMVVQLLARSESARELRNSLDDVLPAPGPLGHMIRGRVQWPLPMPLRIDSAMGWRASAVALVPPQASIWIEDDPRVVTRGVSEVPAGKALASDAQVPLLAVSESDRGRVALSGGAGWPMSGTAGLADARGMLRFPGNRDLFVGVVRWLVRDDSVMQGTDRGVAGESGGALAVVWLPAIVLLGTRLGIAAWRRRA